MGKMYLPLEDILVKVRCLSDKIDDGGGMVDTPIYGVPNGGIPVVYMLCALMSGCRVTYDVHEAHYIVDDLVDSGATRDKYDAMCPDIPFLALYEKTEKSDWLVFPWEKDGDDDNSADDIPIRLLQHIGEDPKRGGLKETPKRFLKAWNFYSSGYDFKEEDIKNVLKVFEDGAEKCDEMVIQTNIPVYSQCEHHLAPFFGVAHIAYIPNGKIVGLSKMSRLVEIYARRLQVQERLTNQIADALMKHLEPLGVGVVIKCRHLCMESRGIQQQGTQTITSALRGAIKEEHDTRDEFMRLIP